MKNSARKKILITEQELIEQTMDKYQLRFWQQYQIFWRDADGLYDARWVEVWNESQQYRRTGFSEWDAMSEACDDIFGFRPLNIA